MSSKSYVASFNRDTPDPVYMCNQVTHPALQHRSTKPSIAASTYPQATKYEVQIRIQGSEQNEKIILDMKHVTVNLLMKFSDANKGWKTEKTIMFHDGVSEGQFLKVCSSHLLNK